MSGKMRKNYNLNKETVEKIHQVMKERNMNETALERNKEANKKLREERKFESSVI